MTLVGSQFSFSSEMACSVDCIASWGVTSHLIVCDTRVEYHIIGDQIAISAHSSRYCLGHARIDNI